MSDLTFDEIRRFLMTGWGELGARTADAWLEFNREHFAGELQPIPLFLTQTTPFGKRLAYCRGADESRHIALNMPKTTGHGDYRLVADRDTLLHEMIHQYLHERDEDPKHAGEPWRREIMRLHQRITGERIWAAASVPLKQKQPDGSLKSVRTQKPDPETGQASITQIQIARWPHEFINLGPL